jgi:hypothetical protein
MHVCVRLYPTLNCYLGTYLLEEGENCINPATFTKTFQN